MIKDNCFMTSLKEIEKILHEQLKEPFTLEIEDCDRVYLIFPAIPAEGLGEASVGLWEYLDVLGEFYETEFEDYALLAYEYDKDNAKIIFTHPKENS